LKQHVRSEPLAPLTRGPVLLVCLFVFLEVQPYRLPSGARITYPVFIIISLALLLIFRRQLWNNIHVVLTWPMAFFAAYILWIVLSAFWSYHTFTSLAQAVPLIVLFLIVICFSGWSPTATAKSVALVGAAVALLSWVMFLVWPSSAVIPDVVWRLNGPLMHSQRLALLMGVSLVCLVALILNNEASVVRLPRYVLGLGLALLAGTLFATNARAFIGFTLSTVLLLVFVRMRPQARVLSVLMAGLMLALVLLSLPDLYGLVGRGRDVTLTGRIPLWGFTVDMISQRPLLGFGFATFGSDLTRPATDVWIAPHAHNAWFNAAFETGIVGAALLTMFLVASLVMAVRAPRSGGASSSYLLGPTVFTILCSSMGLLVGGRLTTPYALLLLLVAQVAMETRRAGRRSGAWAETSARDPVDAGANGLSTPSTYGAGAAAG
jgi:exopolysaccharide production protein ExoQ